jgi:CDP-4-dehydro-6-deoxyglucose reductase/ferredoxin-NAD(P)+ reductase (naphthalene dioxygenase ferredoxin-specific)
VLDAALDAGISYPRYCKTGVCGSCKSILVAGTIDHDSHTQVACSDEERGLGRFLACRARPTSDCTVALIPRDVVPRFVNVAREYPCRVAAIEPATHDVVIVKLTIATGGPFVFTAGQYAHVTFDRLGAREMSMANRPGDPTLDFHIRCVPGSDVAAFVADKLRVGKTATVKGPYGNAFFREYHGTEIIAVAGGTGIAPIKSIVDMALTAGVRQPLALYFGVRTERDIYLEDHFRGLAAKFPNFTFTLALSEAKSGRSRRTGLVSDALAADLAPGRNVRVYFAGPPPMVEATAKVLERAGVRRKNWFADYFDHKRAAVSA